VKAAQGQFLCGEGSFDVYYTPYLPAAHGAAWNALLAAAAAAADTAAGGSAGTSATSENTAAPAGSGVLASGLAARVLADTAGGVGAAGVPLRWVRVEEASLGGVGAAHLAHQLRKLHTPHAPPLDLLSLRRNGITSAGAACLLRACLRPRDSDGADAGGGGYRGKQPLALHLDLNPLGDGALRGLPGCVAASGARGSLQELSLRRCSLGAGAAQSLASALCARHHRRDLSPSSGGSLSSSCGPPQLRRLYLCDNPAMGDAGCVALATSLSRDGACPHLQVLSLANCGVGDVGATALAAALRRHPSLKQLDLGRNRIGPRGAAELAQVRKRQPPPRAQCDDAPP
jgi:hypothetical protein